MRASAHALSLALAVLLLIAGAAHAQRVSDVRNTRHNLSTSGPGPTRSATSCFGTVRDC